MDEENYKSVVIDAGHGGKDSGAAYAGTNEKTLNLIFSSLVFTSLMREKNNVIAYVTRGIDEFVELADRQKIANYETECDALVSIHCNAAQDTAANGMEVWCHPTDVEGNRFAKLVHARLKALNLFKDRGIKQSDKLAMLKCRAPECLVEVGFVSNDRDRAVMLNIENQVKIATAIRLGIQDFIGENNENNSETA